MPGCGPRWLCKDVLIVSMNRSFHERLYCASNFFMLPANGMKPHRPPRPTGAAFLLAQLGAHAADCFAERIEGLGVAPRHAGILRIIATTPACNQRLLAKRLGVLPSRMVILLDELTEKGLLERK